MSTTCAIMRRLPSWSSTPWPSAPTPGCVPLSRVVPSPTSNAAAPACNKNSPAAKPMPDVTIRPFDTTTATEAEWAAFTALRNTLLAERDPEMPPEPAAWVRAEHQTHPSEGTTDRWAAWDAAGAMVAMGQGLAWTGSENEQLTEYDLAVHPAWRRQGLARALLARLEPFLVAAGRPYLLAACYDTVPAGAAFQERLGAHLGLVEWVSRLRLDEV